MARTLRALPCRNGKPTSLLPSHPTSPLRLLRTQRATVTLCSLRTPASSILCWDPPTYCIRGREQRCSTGCSAVRYESWPQALEGAVGLHREPSSQCSAWVSRSEWTQRRFLLSDGCVNALTRSSQTHLLTSSNSCCSWKTTVITPGYCSQSRFLCCVFCYVFAMHFNSVKLKAWNIHKCTDVWHKYEFVHCSILCFCIAHFIYSVIVIYIVFAKINMHIHKFYHLYCCYIFMVKGVVQQKCFYC